IRSPHNGVVDRVLFKLGDHVPEYDTVIEVSDPSELELQVRLSQDEYDNVFPDQKALIEVSRDDWREGVVIQTVHRNPSDDATISRDIYYARVELLEPAEADMSMNSRLSARIILEERLGTLAIPISALREFKDQTYVRVLEGDVRREVYVKTGIRTETQVEILEGLEEGMLVVGR
ncbi:efflux RND transporter periplasmic adaptor subunit, partial [Candidatus Uhrbacteria bacterium]|nr:efflux RND transporter periplasmic adaptor subunit [Candidatus Uhrbacteria bacterium]